MAKPNLVDGSILTEAIANASIRPYVTTNPLEDEAGSMPPLVDGQLTSNPGNIKSNFYGWYRRCELAVSSGLLLNYSSFDVMIGNGQLVSKPAGIVAIPNNESSFVYINKDGDVVVGSGLALECVPLASVVTNNGEITSIIDLRYQEVEQVRPIGLPAQASPLSIGDMKVTARINLEPGWIECMGQTLSTALYPALFDAIGYAYGGSGNSFKVPDLRGRVPLGAGGGTGLTNRQRGQYGGVERHTLNLNEIPSHGHGISDAGHSHSFIDPGHSHAVNDPAHNHTILDPGHEHSLQFKRSTTTSDEIRIPGAELSVATGDRPIPNTSRDRSNVRAQATFTGITLGASATGVGIGITSTGINVLANGGGASHENMPPFAIIRWVIKAG